MIENTFSKTSRVIGVVVAELYTLMKQADDNIAALQARRDEIERTIKGLETSAGIIGTGPGDGKLRMDDGAEKHMPAIVRPKPGDPIPRNLAELNARSAQPKPALVDELARELGVAEGA